MTGAVIERKIALITCSTRKPRLNPYVTEYVRNILAQDLPKDYSLHSVDIADQNLPLYDESKIPSTFPAADPTPHYEHEHSRKWSAEIRKYDAFIFVTPQYNWSVPASLKNAVDYLFHEWSGKPGAIVSYGGHGGTKSADHLRTIMGGINMKPVPTSVALNIDRKTMLLCELRQEQLDVWKNDGSDDVIRKMFSEIVDDLKKE